MSSTERPVPTATAAVVIADLAAIDRFAARLVGLLPATAMVALAGDLGAGKTTLVKAVAAAVGIDPAGVTSPTFGLIHLHDTDDGSLQVAHADMYRLTGVEELAELGWEELIEPQAGRRCWVFVEWPERIATALPAERLEISIAITGETTRQLTVTGRGARYATIPTALTFPDSR